MADSDRDQVAVDRRGLDKNLEAAGWGLFSIWIGIALSGRLGWGAGLIGVGIITLGTQVARNYFALKLEGFWVVVGFLFVVSGVWKLFNIQLGILLILCIVAGATLLVSTLMGGREINRPGRIGPWELL